MEAHGPLDELYMIYTYKTQYVGWLLVSYIAQVRISYPIQCGCGNTENLKHIGYRYGYI
jgi:hypothetical protein